MHTERLDERLSYEELELFVQSCIGSRITTWFQD